MIYDVSYKIFIGAKPLCIMFDEVDGFIKDYGGINYLVLLSLEKYDVIFERIRYLIGLKNGILHLASHNY